MSANALKLHKTLYSKHASMLNCRYLEFARTSFEYQRTITAEVVGQRDGKALLGPWWSLLKEDKRATRIKFLESILHAFQFDLASSNEVRRKIHIRY
jgi:cohesin loading factor subunit SCC2